MTAVVDMLKPTEAAVVARVALRDVNRAIDEHILPEGFFTVDDGRRVMATACTLISFYFDSARHLTSEERLFAIREVGSRLHKFRSLALSSLLEKDWTVRDEFLTIDLAPFVRRTKERMDRLAAARDLVVTDPEVLGGEHYSWHPYPRLRRGGVRGGGRADDRILASILVWTSTRSNCGDLCGSQSGARPSIRRGVPKGAVIMADRRVVRRRKAG